MWLEIFLLTENVEYFYEEKKIQVVAGPSL